MSNLSPLLSWEKSITVSLNSTPHKITVNVWVLFVISGVCVVLPSCFDKRSMAEDCTLHLNRSTPPNAGDNDKSTFCFTFDLNNTHTHTVAQCNFSTFSCHRWVVALCTKIIYQMSILPPAQLPLAGFLGHIGTSCRSADISIRYSGRFITTCLLKSKSSCILFLTGCLRQGHNSKQPNALNEIVFAEIRDQTRSKLIHATCKRTSVFVY